MINTSISSPTGRLSGYLRCRPVVPIVSQQCDTIRVSMVNLGRRRCRTLPAKDSHREPMRLDGSHDEAFTRPLPHDELVQLQRRARERIIVDLAVQGDGLACAA